ncbi:hypothetical protein S40293_02958 [Stachybotrys chartarum IBT 40293]|nr:hypothetical protein S40293_02958 [Stachybotrys chartarum IBT 40293]
MEPTYVTTPLLRYAIDKHNIDYNSLKHEIKAQTTRDQASAMTIPGQQNASLAKFEETFYRELQRQHDRVHLFVISKADELSRRLDQLASKIRRWLDKTAKEPDHRVPFKYQRRYLKLERELEQCGDAANNLIRFSNAQIVAFRKLIKKYKKWTGSSTLGARVNQDVLGDPKSFTRRDFTYLQNRYQDLRTNLKAASPGLSQPSSPSTVDLSGSELTARRHPQVTFEPLPEPQAQSSVTYWNEYDYGSEGDSRGDEEYAIYFDNSRGNAFPSLALVKAALALPFDKVQAWFRSRQPSVRQPLLAADGNGNQGYASTNTHVESDEDDSSSVEELPVSGYNAIYAFPSITDQKVLRYREHALMMGSIGTLIASYALVVITSMLVVTGKHKLRVEVDVGITFGVVVSLFCACSGLAMMLYREERLSVAYRLLTWIAFGVSCILNGMLLVFVVGNSP